MAENEDLRLDMERYLEKHDLVHLFNRLGASIMYDRPDDLNNYICEWLVRLSGNNLQEDTAEEEPVPQSEPAEEPLEAGNDGNDTPVVLPEPEAKTSVPEQPLKRSTVASMDHIMTSSLVPVPSAFPPADAATKKLSAVRSVPLSAIPSIVDFGPFLFTTENIRILYGILDPMNEGFIAADHFREVTRLMDVEKFIDWTQIGADVDRDFFYEQLEAALATDLSSLQRTSGEMQDQEQRQHPDMDVESEAMVREDRELSMGISDIDLIDRHLLEDDEEEAPERPARESATELGRTAAEFETDVADDEAKEQ